MTVVEKWKDIVGYEGLYKVSTLGRVKTLHENTRIADKNTRIMRQKEDTQGYYRVNLYKDKKCKSELVSRLVATAFIENPYNLPHVGHMNDNKKDNTVTNLYWTEPYENNRHNGKLERLQKAHKNKIKTIAKKLSMKIIGTSIENGSCVSFESMQMAQRHGFNSGKISMCVNGKRRTHKGYVWEKKG